jgi:hypothetical protein
MKHRQIQDVQAFSSKIGTCRAMCLVILSAVDLARQLYETRFNTYYTWSGGDVQECGLSLADWQKQGEDKGSAVMKDPDDDMIIHWARELLDKPWVSFCQFRWQKIDSGIKIDFILVSCRHEISR